MENWSNQQAQSPSAPSSRMSEKTALTLFLIVGLAFMAGIVYFGMFILGRELPPSPQPAQANRATLDSLATAPTLPDDKSLEIRKGMAFWFRADAFINPKDSTPVSALPDASGRGNIVRQSAPDARPILFSKALNGKPALRFDGTNDYFSVGNLTDTSAATIFAVWSKPTSGGTPYQRLYSSGGRGIDYQTSGAVYIPDSQNQGVGSAPAQIHVDVLEKADLLNFNIGKLNASALQYYFGDLAEIIVYTRKLTNAEQEAVKTYLRKKYNIQ